jgi:hypothetical protein
MLEQYEALGEVTAEGRFEVFDRAHMLKAIQHFKRGTVLFSMKVHRETRSNAQNRFWHGVVVPAFVDHCGYTFAEAKDALALELLPKEVVDVKTGEVKTVPGHTSDLNTKEFNELIERAQQLGAEMGIYIPDPGEDVKGRRS